MKGDKGRYYSMEYDVEEPERYFEHSFLVDCQRFVVTVDYPINMDEHNTTGKVTP
jgi:hypothetical protein